MALQIEQQDMAAVRSENGIGRVVSGNAGAAIDKIMSDNRYSVIKQDGDSIVAVIHCT